MFNVRLAVAAAVSTVAIAAAVPAIAAPVIGDQVNCAQVNPNSSFSCFQPTATVGAGAEFQIGNNPTAFLSVDFGNNIFNLSALMAGSLSQTIVEFTAPASPISSFSFLGQTGFAGFDVSDVTLSNGVLRLDLRGTEFAAGDNVTLGFGAVPEPATWALMILGMGAVGGAMRRRSAVKASVRFA